MFLQLFHYFLAALPLIVPIIWFSLRIERRLTKIETNIVWMRGNCKLCPPTSDKNSP